MKLRQMNLCASVVGPTAYHNLIKDDDGKLVFRTYTHDPALDRAASDSEADEFCETARLCGGYVRRGAGMGRQR